MMLRTAVTCAGAMLVLASCSQSTQPVQPSPATTASVNQTQQVLSSHKFDGQTAHVQFNTQVNGTIVAAAFFADHIKDKSTVSGTNKFDDVIIGIFQQDAADPNRVLMQTFVLANIGDRDFAITGNSSAASLRTTVPVFNNADGTTVPVTLALDFTATTQILNDTSSRQKFRFGDFTLLIGFKEFTTIADVRGTASWTAGGVATTVTAPLANGDTFGTLDSTVSVDRFTSK
jgi:hypothetical protein